MAISAILMKYVYRTQQNNVTNSQSQDDTILFISYSGHTPELLNTVQHIPRYNQIIALTSHSKADACPLLVGRPDAILLPAPIHESEEASFGVSAPSTSATVALVIGQSLALSVAQKLHGTEIQRVFKKNHPGGAIGMIK
jgi:D-arabinose 5-phosphate isomerase GutQ